MSSAEEIQKMIAALNKQSQKDGIVTEARPPEFYVDSGNYVINKIISGKWLNGWAQGRLGSIGGPSGSGKSYLIGNAIKAAQQQGCFIFILDSENALDESYLSAIGVDVESMFMYRGVTTIEQAVSELQAFTKWYRANKMDMKVFIAVDSLDMLMTNGQMDHYNKGETAGDQGQHVRQLKDMLKSWVQDIKPLPFVMVCAKQVYLEQDRIKKMNEPYVFTPSSLFAFSQILMVSKLLLKTEDVEGKKDTQTTEKFAGIIMKVRGYKTRFTKVNQQAKVQVPWDGGMDRFSGLLDAAAALGVVVKNGGWFLFGEKKFQRSSFSQYQEEILQILVDRDNSGETDDEINIAISEPDAAGSGDGGKKAKIAAIIKKLTDDEE